MDVKTFRMKVEALGEAALDRIKRAGKNSPGQYHISGYHEAIQEVLLLSEQIDVRAGKAAKRKRKPAEPVVAVEPVAAETISGPDTDPFSGMNDPA